MTAVWFRFNSKRQILIRVVALLALAGAATAQQTRPAPAKPAAPQRYPISAFSVEGNRLHATPAILALSGLRVGQTVGTTELEAARQKLLDSGLFEQTGFRFAPNRTGAGYLVTLVVSEATLRFPLHFEELGVSPQEARAWLQQQEPLYTETLPATEPVIQRFTGAVQRLRVSRGLTNPITASVSAENPDKPVLLFRPAGPLSTVADVRFTGNRAIDNTVLYNSLASLAIGVAYREERIRQIVEGTLRPLYEERGYYQVAFPKITAEDAGTTRGKRITVDIQEGPAYQLGRVELTGAPNTASRETLLKAAQLRSNTTANGKEVQAGLDRIRTTLQANGYMRADVQAERQLDEAARRINFTLRVTPGPLFTFGRLQITGLDIFTEPSIRKLWSLQPGQPFKADYPTFFLSQVREQGILENLKESKATNTVDEEKHVVDVTLAFR